MGITRAHVMTCQSISKAKYFEKHDIPEKRDPGP